MAQVSVIGLGAMGSRLARVLLEQGHQVTVWNRGPLPEVKAVGLERAGARPASSPAEAAAAAPLVLMCVLDYAAADQLLAAPGVLDALAGRTLVQFTNGSEGQVRGQMTRVREAGGRILSGSIVGYPRHVGRAETLILYSGDATAFAEHEDTLSGLAGDGRYMGEDPRAHNAIYVAAFGFYFAALAGFLESAALASSRGVPVAEYAAAMPGMTALLLDHVTDAARRIEEGDFRGDQATVDVHLTGSSRRRLAFRAEGLQSLMTDAFVKYCRQAHEAGEGSEDVAALFKRMRPPRKR